MDITHGVANWPRRVQAGESFASLILKLPVMKVGLDAAVQEAYIRFRSSTYDNIIAVSAGSPPILEAVRTVEAPEGLTSESY